LTVKGALDGSGGVCFTGLGTVTPVSTVTVKSRVDGQLMSVYFCEGEVVAKGKPLAGIDPRPFQAQLTQAQGHLCVHLKGRPDGGDGAGHGGYHRRGETRVNR